MALLSDGVQNVDPYWEDEEVQNNLNREIFIDTVALGADADFDLMYDIAQSTSGVYRGAATTYCPEIDFPQTTALPMVTTPFATQDTFSLANELADVYKAFAERARMEERIGDWSGLLDRDAGYEQEDYYVNLENGLPEVTISLNWDTTTHPGYMMMYINDVFYKDYPDAEVIEDESHAQVRLKTPAPGEYKITVRQSGYFSPFPHRLMVSAKSMTNALPIPDSVQSTYTTDDDSIPIRIFVGDDTSSITDANITAEITSPTGNVTVITLEDDGMHSDSRPDDGLYGGAFEGLEEGVHTVVIIVEGTDKDGNEFTRRVTDTIVVNPASEELPICVLGENTVDIRDRTVVTTDVAAGTYLEIGASATLTGNGFVGGDALIRSYGSVGGGVLDGNLTLAGVLSDQGDYTITGTLIENATPTIPTLIAKTFSTGSGFQEVAGVQALSPGDYGDVAIRPGAFVTLNSGVYNFASLNVEVDVNFIVNGAVDVNVQGDFQFGDRSYVIGGNELTVYSNGSQVRIGTDAIFNGILMAPNANVTVFSRSEINGCLGGEYVMLDTDVVLNGGDYYLPTDDLPESTCNDGIQNGDETGVDCGGSCPDDCPCNEATYEAESMSSSTGGAYPDGWNIWSNGHISTIHDFNAGPVRITVMALGEPAVWTWPHMLVTVGGVPAYPTEGVSVTSGSFQAYEFTFDAAGGPEEIQVIFDNDYNMLWADRNLIVDKVIVDCGP